MPVGSSWGCSGWLWFWGGCWAGHLVGLSGQLKWRSAGVKARTMSHITWFESWLVHFVADLLGLWN